MVLPVVLPVVLLVVASVLNGVAIVSGDVVASSKLTRTGPSSLDCGVFLLKCEVFYNGSLIQPCTWAMELRPLTPYRVVSCVLFLTRRALTFLLRRRGISCQYESKSSLFTQYSLYKAQRKTSRSESASFIAQSAPSSTQLRCFTSNRHSTLTSRNLVVLTTFPS